MVDKICPLCGKTAGRLHRDPSGADVWCVECETCGRFEITDQALMCVKPEQKVGLSSVCRRADLAKTRARILSTNIELLLSSLPQYTPPEKLDNLLQLMAQMTPALGNYTGFDSSRDYPILVVSGPGEVNYLMQELFGRQYVNGTHDGVALTMTGWERLEEIRRQGRTSTRCFVAMWFHELMNEVYEQAIAPAIIQAGYEPLRIDKLEHVNRIDDEIIGQIKRSRFMVADFTGQRHGVYFEAGLMQGIGRTVIWMCRKDGLTKDGGLHFDIRQFNFIAYDSTEEARKRLCDRILALEGEGPLAATRS
jgi:hypothetical protein